MTDRKQPSEWAQNYLDTHHFLGPHFGAAALDRAAEEVARAAYSSVPISGHRIVAGYKTEETEAEFVARVLDKLNAPADSGWL